ncbi:hypothetical protein KAFR_0J00670 [Kazachstania africana CBS 2517]|uniref:Uncharacterized protein n=1 Tax=Kazachstania africana (strain ATCC 22294 / BCRC 22015 / CBS 2517 / CECT 1963 / NBRC 1671 / NRRL Y-8276) TaxID=1071382 RepID=H2B0I5_KAZAF|nr:hypothetical protein KAFR_0J00670 [Kazachstania africana CBS 2517]CCF60135.1 hypothetical protein KAFR_0J00670 [Kazachstania africana CBS 2517]
MLAGWLSNSHQNDKRDGYLSYFIPTKIIPNHRTIPSAMDSISRFKRRSYNRVRRSRSHLSSHYSRFVNDAFSMLKGSEKPELVLRHPQPSHINSDTAKYVSSSYSDTISDSETQTLVNSLTSSSSLTIDSRATPVMEEDLKDLVEEKFRSISSTPELFFETTKEAKLSSEQIKSLIKIFGYDRAYELGKSEHLHYYQLPFPYRENRYIINNYRFYDSHKKSLLSIFKLHNEATNIWSHLLGAIYFLYVLFHDLPNSIIVSSSMVPTTAKLFLYLFVFASLKCMLSSTFYHTFNGTSMLKLRRKFMCVDYSGISILITSSILSIQFISLYDYPNILKFYMCASFMLGVLGIFMNWSPLFDSPEARPLRIKFFILLSSCGAFALLHLVFLEKSIFAAIDVLLPLTNKSIVWYLVGVVFYGSFIPERFRTDYIVDKSIPTTLRLSTDLSVITTEKHIHFRNEPTKSGKSGFFTLWWVDYLFCSHTLWHIFVVLGVVGHYKTLCEMFLKKWLI